MVAQVWKLIRKGSLSLPQAIVKGQDQREVACILHQAAYFTCTLANCPFDEPAQGVGHLRNACRNAWLRAGTDDDGAWDHCPEDEVAAQHKDAAAVDHWALARSDECPSCAAADPHKIIGNSPSHAVH